MKFLLTITVLLVLASLISAAIPTASSMRDFLSDLNEPLAVMVNGCNFNASLYLGGTPHFNITAGVTSTGSSINDAAAEGKLEQVLSLFHIKGTAGLLEGFSPAPSWQGLGGVEVGAKAFAVPLFGDIGKNRERYPYGLGGFAKLNLLRGSQIIPTLSFSFEYNHLFNGAFEYHDYASQETAKCAFTLSSFYYHLDMMTQFNLINVHAGIGWITPSLKADFTIADSDEIFESEQLSLFKYYGGVSVPVELVDVSIEAGQADQNTFFGIGIGFRM